MSAGLVDLAREFVAEANAKKAKEAKEVGSEGTSFALFASFAADREPTFVDSDPATWPLSEINRRNVVIATTSTVLGEPLLLVPDTWLRPAGEERMALRVRDLRKIASLRPPIAALRTMTHALSVFDGRIES